MRDIAFLIFPEFQILDLSGPLAAFEIANEIGMPNSYCCSVVSLSGAPVTSSSGLEVKSQKIRSTPYDTLIVVGGKAFSKPYDLPLVSDHLANAVAKGTRRVASVCTGAFLLASAGLLDGRKATTHWMQTARLQTSYPKVRVQPNHIFTKDGGIWTSAGISAGIDLALAMVEEDLGSPVSHEVARAMVVYHRRPGGQSQFSAMADMEPTTERMREVLSYMREHLNEQLSTAHLASIACLSLRQFGRAFLLETGETPAKAVERMRIEAAKLRIERSAEPIELIAHSVGFKDPERMRRAFIRVIGHPPQSIRRLAAHQGGAAYQAKSEASQL